MQTIMYIKVVGVLGLLVAAKVTVIRKKCAI